MLAAMLALLLGAALAQPAAAAPALPVAAVAEAYVERYFDTYPSQATAAGRHDLDVRLEDLSPERLAAWVAFNRETAARLRALLAGPSPALDDRLDAELLLAQAEREVHELAVRRRPERDPLWWTGLAGNVTVFLLVRDDLPEGERLERAAERATHLPRLAMQARLALAGTDLAEIAPEHCRLAAGQARANAAFYREGFASLAAGRAAPLARRLRVAATAASLALDAWAVSLDGLAARATGSPRLGDDYAATFRLGTGVETPVDELLREAEAALRAKRAEAAAYGREVWARLLPGEAPPADDAALLARLFARAAEDRAESVEEFVADYRDLVAKAEAFAREHAIVTLPDPLTLHIDRSPAFFLGQSVGGVYPAGPYQPEAKTLFFLPAPPASATPAERDAFFRDFNHHFNVMITPHEMVPGHYLQLKWAARHPRKVRALFPDGVYVEGWGTFCERLLLDLGWGGPLDRLAHLKKQLENIARTVVDVRVHTRGMTRDEVLAYVRGEALQDEQFAANMWTRAITSSPQIATYFLGYREVQGLYDDVRRDRGPAFRLREFMDGMMELGPVPVRHYRVRLLPAP